MSDLLAYSRKIEAKCPNRANHTKTPDGYVDHAEWVERMAATHDQTQCPACGLWAIWIKRVERPKPVTGTCCSCGYSGSDATDCPTMENGVHCNHWHDGDDSV